MKFANLDLAPALLRAVEAKGYETATPIQIEAIPPILAGRDVIGCAQTGTGKTAAFALPTLQRLLASVQQAKQDSPPSKGGARGGINPGKDATAPAVAARRREAQASARPVADRSSKRKTRALVLAPTRELASQIAASFANYGRFTALRHTTVYGGVSQFHQVKALEHGVDALVATPGRLLDLMQQRHVDLQHVEVLILDEADQMLDMGFLPDLRRIVARVPHKRQTLMFSATMPEPIRKLADEWLADPVSLHMAPVGTPAERVEQSVYYVEKTRKPLLLEAWLQQTGSARTLVFARTKHGADKIVKHLSRGKIRAAAIHGNKSQNARERTLEQFKSERPPVLVATDIAARGLDIKEVAHVVNYDLPATPEVYVHRIGRTGRAGAAGVAISFCSAEEVKHLRDIERLTRRRIATGQGHAELTAVAPPAHVDAAPASRASGGARRSAGGRPPVAHGQQRRRSSGGPPASTPPEGRAAVKRRRYGTDGQRAAAANRPATATGAPQASTAAGQTSASSGRRKTGRRRIKRAL